MSTILSSGLVLADLWSTTDVTATSLPIGLQETAFRTMLRVEVPCQPGDLLDIVGDARVTLDTPEPRYTTGVSWSLWGYDEDNGVGGSEGPWWLLGTSLGDNVTPDRHHMPLSISRCYQVPATWTPGHRLVVVLRAVAGSTAARAGDAVTVDKLGELTVRRWTAPTAPPAPTV